MKRGSRVNRLLDRGVGIPVLGAASLINRRRAFPNKIGNIGFLSSQTMGDTLIASAAIQDLRGAYQGARTFYFAAKSNEAAVRLIPGIDEIVHVEMTDPVKGVSRLRECCLDLLIDFSQWQRLTAFLVAFSGARYRVGFKTKDQYRHWHYDLTVDHSGEIHELENFRNLVRALGVDPSSEPRLAASVTPPSSPKIPPGRVIFHPWATGDMHALREWENEKWVALATAIQGPKTEFVVTGSLPQSSKSEQLCGMLRKAGVRANQGKSSSGLESLCDLLNSADLTVSVNTGVMHLSAILGVPTVGLNGPTAGHRWGPIGPRAIGVSPRNGSGGYLNLGFEFDRNSPDCMKYIEVEDVVVAICQLASMTDSPVMSQVRGV